MPQKENANNFIGKTFNNLTIIEDLGRDNKRRWAKAICICGTIRRYRVDNLKDGTIKSCGCIGKKLFEKNRLKGTHNLTNHPLYSVWEGIKKRCYNQNNKSYPNYGGKGVIVCEDWLKNFKAFYDWAIVNGYKKGLEIDKDKLAPSKTGNLYCPEYCCFYYERRKFAS